MRLFAHFTAFPLVDGARTKVSGTVRFDVNDFPESPEATIDQARRALRFQNPSLASTPIQITKYGFASQEFNLAASEG
jgi:hypothetical protein